MQASSSAVFAPLAWVLAAAIVAAAAATADWRRVAGDDDAHRAWGVATAVAFLAGAALPAAIAQAGLGWAVRGRDRLGPLPWVAGAFVTGAASMAASVALRAGFGSGTGAAAPAVPDAATGAALLLAMAFAEAQLSAGVVATVAAQRPHWLARPGAGARGRR